ncbi:MAG: hypothetical protein AAF607_02795, partial [Pseudomonadota bacterium]
GRVTGVVGETTIAFTGLNAVAAQTPQTIREISKSGATMAQELSRSMDTLSGQMSNAFERFLKTGKLSFDDLKNVATSALDSIFDRAISSGLDAIFGSSGGGLLGSLFGGFGGFSFAPRATGGPVDANRAFLVGEAGPEIFVPGQSGQIVRPQGAATAPINITVNMHVPNGASQGAMRQSASQIASQVSRAVSRAQRNG